MFPCCNVLYICSMDEKERKIIEGAVQVFMKFGIKSVNMDDIARNLGVSKKTLYRFVRDKEELVSRAMEFHCELEDREMDAICAKGLNAIDESFEMMKFILGILKNIHPSIMFDMQKYHPSIMKEMMEGRSEQIFKCIYSNLEKGIQEGLYRDDLDPDIIANTYIAMVETMMKGVIYPKGEQTLPKVYLEIFRYHTRGIASEKGLIYLQDKVKKEQKNIDLSSTLNDL